MMRIRLPYENLHLLKMWAKEEGSSVTALVTRAIKAFLEKGVPDDPLKIMSTTTTSVDVGLQEELAKLSYSTFISSDELVRRAVQALIDQAGKSLSAEEKLQLREEALVMREERLVKTHTMHRTAPERHKKAAAGSKALNELYGLQPKKKTSRL